MTATRAPAVRRGGRREQIVAAAAEQFRTSGYHNVGINDIGDAVGLTGPAIYRHFRGKQALLLATIEDSLEQFIAVYEQPYDDLHDMLEAIAVVTLQHRNAGVLWQREAGHLPPDRRRELLARFRRAVQPLRALVTATRPDLSADDVDLLLWACQDVFVSVGYHQLKLDAARATAQLVDATMAICTTAELPIRDARPGRSIPMPRGHLLPASRREAAIVAAARLFATRGYQAVSMDDIGAAAGITGPSLYHHFPSKSAILFAQLARCLDSVMFDLTAALDLADTPGEALDFALRGAVRTNLEHGVMMGALLSEMVNVPADERRALHRIERDYSAEWVALLTSHRAELSDAEAQVLVQAFHTVIGLLGRRPHFRQRPAFAEELAALGRAVLGLSAEIS